MATVPGQRQTTLVLATAAAVVGVLAGVLLTLGYGDAISAVVGKRKRSGTERETDTETSDTNGYGRDEEGERKSGRMRSGDGVGSGASGRIEAERGGVEGKRNVKEGIEGCIGNTPLIRIVSSKLDVRACVSA